MTIHNRDSGRPIPELYDKPDPWPEQERFAPSGTITSLIDARMADLKDGKGRRPVLAVYFPTKLQVFTSVAEAIAWRDGVAAEVQKMIELQEEHAKRGVGG